jgi:hypothetical protein
MGRTAINMLIRYVIGFFMTFLLARFRATRRDCVMASATAEAGLSKLQALPEALVYKDFDIYVPIELAVIRVSCC